WFTLSHGILNEIYYPTIDRPQVRDMQFLITDGETFFHEEKRDLENTISYIEEHTLGYRIESADREGRYRFEKEIITDPHQPCLLIHTRLYPAPEWTARLRIYALLAPHLELGGWGNSARRLRITGKTILLAWKGRTYLAMGADTGFTEASCGYVGASDAWQDLRDNRKCDWQFERAEDGNIAVTGQVDISKTTQFTVGLAFGDSAHAAITTLFQSLSVPFASHRERYIEQWRRATRAVERLDAQSCDGGRLYCISHSLLLAHEDKTFVGALVASASIPWGEAKGDEDLGGYHLVWTRDMVNSVTALLACGATATAYRALIYLACSQQQDGGFAQNFWIDGVPYWRGIQLDQVAFPVMLAWRLWKAHALGDFDPYPMVKAAAGFLIRHGPCTQQERWEENSGYSPSTLAAGIGGLICAADFARARGDEKDGAFLEEYADFLESHIEGWTVTTQGTLVPGISRHYIRIQPVDIDDPEPRENPNMGMLTLRNRPPGTSSQFQAKEVVDAGFLELVRYGIRPAGDTLIEDSLRVVDSLLKVATPAGPAWYRYNHDGYGLRPDGGPFEGWGKGRLWPLLTGERGHYELAAGRDVKPFIRALEGFASRGGMIPEQVWDEPERPGQSRRLGQCAGAAMPLMWAHAEYVKLLRSARDGQVFDRIPTVAERYLKKRGRKDLEVWKPIRRVRAVSAGKTLRIQAEGSFRLRWTSDEWQTVQDSPSIATGLGADFVDIHVASQQRMPVRFTFLWTEIERWEGRNYEVEVRE
ncbi:MAG: glycoside hydrolase 15-related, partial [Bryobacterales bacterium]|nr:glycoside hydrolase 15-related [Bryobacterales bacterium]